MKVDLYHASRGGMKEKNSRIQRVLQPSTREGISPRGITHRKKSQIAINSYQLSWTIKVRVVLSFQRPCVG